MIRLIDTKNMPDTRYVMAKGVIHTRDKPVNGYIRDKSDTWYNVFVMAHRCLFHTLGIAVIHTRDKHNTRYNVNLSWQ